MSRWLLSPWGLLAGAALGGLIGIYWPAGSPLLQPVATLYISLLKMVVLPFMVASVILGMRKMLQDQDVGRYVRRVVLVFTLGTLACSALGTVSGALIGPGRNLSEDKLAVFGRMIEKTGGAATEASITLAAPQHEKVANIGEQVVQALVPGNLFEALGKGESLQVLVFSILFGIAFGWLPGRRPHSLTDVLDTVYRACHKLVHWFNHLIPMLAAAVVCSVFAQGETAALGAMLKFILSFWVISGILFAAAVVVVMRRARVGIGAFARAFKETLLLAVATTSNTACVPGTIAALEELGFSKDAVELLAPLGAVLFRPQLGLYFAYATVFIGQVYARPLGADVLVLITFGAFATALASAGASGAIKVSFIGMACNYVGFPFEAMFILFLITEAVCDIPREVFGVTANAAASAFIAPSPIFSPTEPDR